MSKRRLSRVQAYNCENAILIQCRCRCGGALHGAKRGGWFESDYEFLSTLPVDDPHYVPSDADRRAHKTAMQRARREALRAVRRNEG